MGVITSQTLIVSNKEPQSLLDDTRRDVLRLIDQDPMRQHGVSFLTSSRSHPDDVATLEDWLAERMQHA